MINPIEILREAIKAVPSVKYALGIGGVTSVVALVSLFGLSPRVATIGTVVVLILMGVLVIFARMASISSAKMLIPAMCFTWFILILFMLTSLSLFTSVFFKKPVDLQYFIINPPDPANAEILDKFPAYELHKKISEINNSKNIDNEHLETDLMNLLKEFALKNPWGDYLKSLFSPEHGHKYFDVKSYVVGGNVLLTVSDSYHKEGHIFFIDIKKNKLVREDNDMGLGIVGSNTIEFNSKTRPNAIVEVEYQTMSGTGTYATSIKIYTITKDMILQSLVKPKTEYNSGWGVFKHHYIELRSKNFYQIDPDTLNYQIRTKGFAGVVNSASDFDTDTDTDTDTGRNIPPFSSVRSLPDEFYIWDEQSQQFVQKEGRIVSGQDLMTSVYSDFADPKGEWFIKPGELPEKDLKETLKDFY